MKSRKSLSNIALVVALSSLILNVSILVAKKQTVSNSPQQHFGELNEAIRTHGLIDSYRLDLNKNKKDGANRVTELLVDKFNQQFSNDYMMVSEIKQDELLVSTYSLKLPDNFCAESKWVTEVNTGFNLKSLSEKTQIVAYSGGKEVGKYEYSEGFERLLGFQQSILCKQGKIQVETIRITDTYDIS